MAPSKYFRWLAAKLSAHESGQGAVEFALAVPIVLVVLFALVDFGRVFDNMQVMIGLSRQGSNLASRGTTLLASAAAVIAGEGPLDLGKNGEVIITSVAVVNGKNTITGQVSQGGISRTSQVGSGVGNNATVPAASATLLLNGQTVYITEVFYTFRPITPIGQFVKMVMPSTLSVVAYF